MKNKKDYIVVLTTVGDEGEATEIARSLVEEKLVACVNYTKVMSVYRWQGKVNKDGEILLICKTTKEKYKTVEEKIKQLHSYECPEVIALPIIDGSREYLGWVGENTKTG